MKKPTDIGANRTGIGMSPIDSKKTIEGAREGGFTSAGDSAQLLMLRERYSKGAPPIGTVPPPATLKGVASTAIEALKGQKANVLIDKLAERLAFERTGTRLYEALMVKLRAASPRPEGPTEGDLVRHRDEEHRHAALIERAIAMLGADPTAMTPCADAVAVASSGIMQVITDPRTTLAQGLNAMLSAELTDLAGWELLSDLARAVGQEKLAEELRTPIADERRHMDSVLRWLAASVLGDAGAKPASGAKAA